MLKYQSSIKKSLNILLILAVIFTLFSVFKPVPALAGGTDFSPQATAGLQVNVLVDGSPVQIANFSLTDLLSWTPHEEKYTSIDSMPAPTAAIASGVYLTEVLQASGINDVANVSSITLYATDPWSQTYTAADLWGEAHYYYPNMVSTWDVVHKKTGEGAAINPEPVQPMFALNSYHERYLDLTGQTGIDNARAKMTREDILRFFFGQTETDIQNNERTASRLGKWVRRMDIALNEGATPPAANPTPLSSPVLSATYRATGTVKGIVGQTDPLGIFFTDNATWREAITEISVDGNTLTVSEQYSIFAGEIDIASSVFTTAGAHWVVIKAAGYTDDCATQVMELPPPLSTPSPALTGSTLSWAAIAHADSYKLVFTPTIGTYNEQIISLTSIDLSTLGLDEGIYSVTVRALAPAGSMKYSDSAPSNPITYISGNKLVPPVWTADNTNNNAGEVITLTYSPSDDTYNQAISAVSINGTVINSSLYDKMVSGQLTFNNSVFPEANQYRITVSAEGYFDASVTQVVFTAAPALAALSLSGSPSLTYDAEPLYFVLTNLTLSGIDQYSASYDITGQSVTWQVVSGPATVSGDTLTINASGTVTVTASIGQVTSNQLALTVASAAGIPNPGNPDEIILTWTGDTETTQTISWRTGTDTNQNQVQYMTAGTYSGDFTGALSATAVQSTLYEGNYHFEVTITGLTPDTQYVYRVGGGEVWSTPGNFKTGKDSNSEYSFLYMGDVQEGIEAWADLLSNVYAQNPNLKFSLMGGDFVNKSNSYSQWERFLTKSSPVFSRIPVMTTPGNHEEDIPGDLVDYPMYWKSFALPQNGPDGYKEQFYSFDYGTCHIAVLDSNIMGIANPEDDPSAYAVISTWLKNDLNNSNQTWKFLLFHHPAYAVDEDSIAPDIKHYWAPVFEQCGVDMAFMGHQHVYMRSNLMYNGIPQADSQWGTVYIMGNSGSKFYPAGTDAGFQYTIARQVANKSNYELVNISGNTITLIAKDAGGNEIDRYTITKPAAAYTITPVADDSVYQTGTAGDGIRTMTVKNGVSGIKYFTVSVTTGIQHRGYESVIFVQLRNGVQTGISLIRTDFDTATEAQAGFNVQPGDVVKAYIVDDISSEAGYNPVILLSQAASSPVAVTASLSCGDTAMVEDEVTVSGNAGANTWIAVRVIDSINQSDVFFGTVRTGGNGAYSTTFTIPENAGNSLTVITGSGYNLAVSTVTVNPMIWHTVTASVNGGNGEITATPDNVKYNRPSVITVKPAQGYHLSTLMDNGVEVFHESADYRLDKFGSYAIPNVTADHEIVAAFAINTYTLTVKIVGSGSLTKSLDKATYEHGTAVKLTAKADADWCFTAWSDNATGSCNPKTIIMNSDKTITVTFARVKASKEETTTTGNVTIDAKNEAAVEVNKSGTGTPVVKVSEYVDNPGAGFIGDTGKYIDVQADNVTDVDEMVIKLYYTNEEITGLVETSLTLRWWNGTEWIICSDSGVNTTDIAGPPVYSGYMWAKIRVNTTPSLADLSGAVFGGSGITPPPDNSSNNIGGGGGGGGLPPGTTFIRGLVSSEGRFTEQIAIVSDDGLCTLEIPKGTVGLDKNLKPINKLMLAAVSAPPALPEDSSLIGLAYDFGPDDITFDPYVTITFTYSPSKILQGVDERNLILAFYDETAKEWTALSDIVVDTVKHTISGKTSHFTTFGVIAYTRPAAFTASGLKITPAEVEADGKVVVGIDIANTGDLPGKYDVVFKVDDKAIETKTISLSGHTSRTVIFTVTRDIAGSYAVSVDNLSGTFTVKQVKSVETKPVITEPAVTSTTPASTSSPENVPPRSTPAKTEPEIPASTNWGLIGGLIVASAVVAGGTMLYITKKKHSSKAK